MNHHHHFILNKSLHDPMSKIYVFHALMTFVRSLIGIFVPVYLYSIGYSLVEIILYTIGHSLVYLIMIPIAVKLIKKFGFKLSLLVALPFYYTQLIFLNFAANPFFFHAAWLFFGIYMSIFWPVFHSEVAVNGSNKQRNSQIGTLQIIAIIFASIAPLIGGFILEFTSYWYLLIFSSILLIIGSLPLILAKDIRLKNFNFDYSDYFSLIKTNKFQSSKKAFACEGVDSLLNLKVWPILVFILLSMNFLKFGMLLTIVSIISVFLIFYIKTYLDKKNKQKFLKKITRLLSFNFFLKTTVIYFGSFFLYFIETFSKLILNTFNLSFSSIFYNNAKKLGYMHYIIFRELYLLSSQILFSLFSILILIFFGETLKVITFLIFFGIISSLGLSYLKEE